MNENNSKNVVSSNRISIGNAAIIVALVGLAISLWNEYEWYSEITPYGTVITTLALIVAFLAYVDLKYAFKDPVFYLMAVADAFALFNLIIIGSDKGAFLTAFDTLMIFYLANKIRFPKRVLFHLYAFVGFFYYYWTFDVKGYFKGYNTNYGGLVLITGFVFAMIGFESLRSYLKLRGYEKAAKWMFVWYAFMFAWGYNIIAWYRARCAFLGLLVFVALVLIPRKIWTHKWLYTLLSCAFTIGAIPFSFLYIGLGKISDVFTINLFYKETISGRNEIWSELWGAYMKQPLTGIGSSYKIQIDWLNGMFEVHSGMLDILFVHGIVVFVAVCALLIHRLLQMREYAVATTTGKFIMAATMAILASSFLENFFIVPPFSLAILVLLSAGNCENDKSLV